MKNFKDIIRPIVLFSILITIKVYLIFTWIVCLKFVDWKRTITKTNVLHIWNIAGVSNTLAYAQRKLGFEADIIERRDLDTFNFFKVHPECFIKLPTSFVQFYIQALFLARKYAVLHVHGYDWIVPYLRFLYPRKIIILHYHGSDIRYQVEEKSKRFKHANLVAVSTSDLLEFLPTATYIPNPVDLDHFTRKKPFVENTALIIIALRKISEVKTEAEEIAKKRKLKLKVLIREENAILYDAIPGFLELYEYYFDLRLEPLQGKLLDTKSLTALQALALGNKVLFQNSIIEKFPVEHSSIEVAKEWKKIYDSLVNNQRN